MSAYSDRPRQRRRTTCAPPLLLLLSFAGCDCRGGDADPSDPDDVPIGGWYRAEIRSDGDGAIPFFVSLPADYESASARIVNGDEELVARHTWASSRVEIEFPIHRTRIEATAREDGTLRGHFFHESPAFGDSELAFAAEPVDEPRGEDRFLAAGEASDPPPDFSEGWRLTFEDSGEAQLTLSRRKGTAVDGALELENGNVIYLAGNLRADALKLSAFDRSSPYLLDATLAGDRLEGRWLAGPDLGWHESVTGAADTSFEIRSPASRLPETHTLPVPELREPPYQGSPILLVLSGSWSPASIRAMPFLNELYREHRDADLEILALNYEFTNDEAYNDAMAEAIADAHAIPWEIVPIDGTAEEYNAIIPAGLEGVDIQSFPVFAFINREGRVHDIRVGFPPEAARDLHAATLAEYRDLVRAIAEDGR